MRSVYFITDFSYDPAAKEPLKLFELGDAFTSEYPEKKLERSQLTAHEMFLNDLCQRYPESLLIQFFPSGFNLLDLATKTEIVSYDKQQLFNQSIMDTAPSYAILRELVDEIMKNAHRRHANSKSLVFYLGCHAIYKDILTANYPTKKNNVEIVNQSSLHLHEAFFDKKVFHEHANASPIYPKTLVINIDDFDSEEQLHIKLQAFMKETKADYYVLKPTNGTHSEHVHIVSANDLAGTIAKIITYEYNPEASGRYHCSGLLVQVCHLSKLIKHNNIYYYAKARAIIRADFSDDIKEMPKLHFVTGYWQMANKAYQNEINDQTVIANIEANPQGSQEISVDDWKNIKSLFNRYFPTILASLNKNYNEPYQPKPWEIFSHLPSTSKKSTPSVQFEEVLSKFFKEHYLIPHAPLWVEKAYYWWNAYVQQRNNNLVIKSVASDILGLDKSVKKSLCNDKKSTQVFINQAAKSLFTGEKMQADSFNDKTNAFAKLFLFYFVLWSGIELLNRAISENEKPVHKSIVLGMIMAIVSSILHELSSQVVLSEFPQRFFNSEAKNKNEEQQSKENVSQLHHS